MVESDALVSMDQDSAMDEEHVVEDLLSLPTQNTTVSPIRHNIPHNLYETRLPASDSSMVSLFATTDPFFLDTVQRSPTSHYSFGQPGVRHSPFMQVPLRGQS